MKKLFWTGFLSVIVAVPCSPADGPFVTEAEFLAVLDRDHPAVTEARAGLVLAEAAVLAAATASKPVLGLVREETGPQTEVSLTWELPARARRDRIAARRASARGTAATVSRRLQELRSNLRATYAAWALAEARADLLQRRADRVAGLAEREARRHQRGESSGLEAHRLRLTASTLRSEAELAQAEGDRTRGVVRQWFPDLPPQARPRLPELSAWSSEAATHPAVRAAEEALAAARLEAQVAERLLPSPALSVGWQRVEEGAARDEGVILGLAWRLPFLDRQIAERTAAAGRLELAEARLALVGTEISTARSAARERYVRLRSATGEARRGLAAKARMLDGAEAAFEVGESDLTDLLEIHRAVTEGELAALELHAAALSAHRQLELLEPPPEASVSNSPSAGIASADAISPPYLPEDPP
ncbi:MAG: TolC family protein [Acidobacteriota bacterium]